MQLWKSYMYRALNVILALVCISLTFYGYIELKSKVQGIMQGFYISIIITMTGYIYRFSCVALVDLANFKYLKQRN